MNAKKRVIVYGLGKAYKNQKFFIEKEFEIIGYSDKNQKDISLYICPEDIIKYEFDYIYVTSTRLFGEIKEMLLNLFPGGGDLRKSDCITQ